MMHKIVEQLDNISAFPNVVRGFAVTGAGAVASSTPEVQEVHWLQLTMWAATAFVGIITGLIALFRLYLDAKKRGH